LVVGKQWVRKFQSFDPKWSNETMHAIAVVTQQSPRGETPVQICPARPPQLSAGRTTVAAAPEALARQPFEVQLRSGVLMGRLVNQQRVVASLRLTTKTQTRSIAKDAHREVTCTGETKHVICAG
jgi:hypothetical protein